MTSWITATTWVSFVLAAAGITGIVLAGREQKIGWIIGMAVQPVWVVFSVMTHGWGLIFTSVGYFMGYRSAYVRSKRKKEVEEMGLTKHGHGQVIREDDDNVKIASQAWSEKDREALDAENADADSDA